MEADRVLEEGYLHTVEDIAKKQLGPQILAEAWRIRNMDFFRVYLPLLHQGITQTDPRGGDFMYFCANVIKPVEDAHRSHHRTWHSSDGVSWAVAAAVVTEDPIIMGLKPIQLRFVYDLALGVAVDDYGERYQMVLRNADYAQKGDGRKTLMEWAKHWKNTQVSYKSLQAKLRANSQTKDEDAILIISKPRRETSPIREYTASRL